ncbi:MAG: hypothetical protein HC865_23615 [Cyanobacteria bacterium RU_5_0]|nr:hypothetical protein [Cyanobacteria bacterium RU_5_0]
MDIRSFDRVIQAILFFDKRINRRAAQVAKIRIVNKFFDANTQKDEPYLHPPFDFFFDRGDIDAPNPDELEKKMLDLAEEHEGEAAQRNAMLAYLEEKNKRPLPEIEEIPVYFYEDGISQLQMMLSMRTIEVMQHWRGNTSFRQYDIIRNMAESLMQQFSEFPEEFSEDESDDLQPPSVHHS